jgi:hypothetical protein
MTPKEKAEYLVNKFHHKMPAQVIPTASTYVGQLSCDIDLMGYFENAKLCALIAVNEIFDIAYWQLYESGGEQEEKYWQEVKQEIEQL